MKIEMKGPKSKYWVQTTVENFQDVLEVTRKVLRDTQPHDQALISRYNNERAMWDIRSGKIVSTPVTDFRLAEGKECPFCGAKFEDQFGALSRRDNKTKICSPCGLKEALEDMSRSK